MDDLHVGDTVKVTIEGTVIKTTQGSFVSVAFRDAYANLHTLWFSGMNKIEQVILNPDQGNENEAGDEN